MYCTSRLVFKSLLQTSFCKCRLHNVKQLQSISMRTGTRLFSSESVEPLPKPNDSEEKYFPPKVQKLVEDISQLTLLEVADLNTLLKKTLKIQDAAPIMAVGATSQSTASQADEEEDVQTVTKSTFTVRLVGYDADKKIALIKEIKNLIPGTNLVQAKKFVESIPVNVKADLTKEESETLAKALENAGGKVETD